MNFDRAVDQNPLHSSVRLNVSVFSKKSLHNEVQHWILLVRHRNILCSAKNALQIEIHFLASKYSVLYLAEIFVFAEIFVLS